MVYITLYIRVYTVQCTVRYNGQQQCTEGHDTRRFRECALIMANIPIDRFALTGTLVQCLVGDYLFHDTHQEIKGLLYAGIFLWCLKTGKLFNFFKMSTKHFSIRWPSIVSVLIRQLGRQIAVSQN